VRVPIGRYELHFPRIRGRNWKNYFVGEARDLLFIVAMKGRSSGHTRASWQDDCMVSARMVWFAKVTAIDCGRIHHVCDEGGAKRRTKRWQGDGRRSTSSMRLRRMLRFGKARRAEVIEALEGTEDWAMRYSATLLSANFGKLSRWKWGIRKGGRCDSGGARRAKHRKDFRTSWGWNALRFGCGSVERGVFLLTG